jgi:hypothetical protein
LLAPDAAISDPHKDFMLAVLRCAKLRVQLLMTELNEIGVALSHGMIVPEDAVAWLYYIRADQYVNVESFTNKIELMEPAESAVTLYTIERIETGTEMSGAAMTKGLDAIKAALEAEGIEFTSNTGVLGVLLHPKKSK